MRNTGKWIGAGLALLLLATPGVAQLGLPSLPSLDLPDVPEHVDVGALSDVDLDRLPARELRRVLDQRRIARLRDYVRDNGAVVEFDVDRNPAVRGQLVVLDMSDTELAEVLSAGFTLAERGAIEALGLTFVRLITPEGWSLAKAEKRLAKLAPNATIDADNIYFPSGAENTAAVAPAAAMLASGSANGAQLGLIDGGVARHDAITNVRQKGFAKGAPAPSSHGTAVAALMVGQGSVRGGAPGAPLLAADVYGQDKAGGNALAISRALGWLVQSNVAVVTISLVGPENRLLQRAITAAQAKGVIVVAAVGNDGPAAPPAYPASYKGVVGVTGVGKNNRILPEASRKSDTDFAAPGKDFRSASHNGGTMPVRGTSFAAPLVAGRLISFYTRPAPANVASALQRLVADARDIGRKGHDPIYGNGLICGECVRR